MVAFLFVRTCIWVFFNTNLLIFFLLNISIDQIYPDDDLPQTICCRCEQRLLDAYHFRKLAESSARGFNRAIAKRSSTSSGTAIIANTSDAPSPSVVSAAAPVAVAPKKKTASSVADGTTRTRVKPAAPAASRQSLRRPQPAAKPSAGADKTAPVSADQQLMVAAVKGNREHARKPAKDSTAGSAMKLERGEYKDTFKIVYLDASEEQNADDGRKPTASSPRRSSQTTDELEKDDPELDISIEFHDILEEPEQEEEEDEGELQLEEDDDDDDDVDDDDDGVSFLIREVEPTARAAETTAQPTRAKRTVTRSAPRRQTANDGQLPTVAAAALAAAADGETPKRVVNNTRTPDMQSEEYLKRKHKCEVCEKRFIGRSNLVDHLRHHANVKPFQCDHCDKAFVQKGSLVCHMRTHTLERPFACDVCGKTFSQASSRQIHMRQHTKERDYVCPVCSKAFYSNSDLSKHKRTHDAVMAFQCPYCSAGFAQKPNMKKHMLKKHTAEVNRSKED